ncbi:MAG: DEAD/DEAH box helicase family protein [Planctomycetota bacterium]
MSLKSLGFKRAYSSDTDDILRDFYVPALAESISYSRLAGFFSSASLAIAARGILGLIENGGTMKLIACPKLMKDDVDAIMRASQDPEKYIAESALHELEQVDEAFVRDHVRALGWMVANKRLEIKLCLPCGLERLPWDHESLSRSGIFHQKVGVLVDREGNRITFSGSVNETATGWLGNIEEFKVFGDQTPLEREYQEADVAKFERFWEGTSPSARTFPVPEAVRKRLIEIAPDKLEKGALSRWSSSKAAQRRPRVELYDYQRKAIDAWVANGRKGIFEMATGTGKTFAALGCIRAVFRDGSAHGAAVSTPYHHLCEQWKGEIDKYGLEHGELVVADSTRANWKRQMASAMMDLSLGASKPLMILTTHNSLVSEDFRRILDECRGRAPLLLVADEVHGLGAAESRRNLSDQFDHRLGLSATPERWFDPVGTRALLEYFGPVIYEFPLEKAITTVNPATGRTFLTPFRYVPQFVPLDKDELAEYVKRTQQLFAALAGHSPGEVDDPRVEWLMFERAKIIKNARAKYDVLGHILDKLGRDLKWTIVYCSPEQIDTAVSMLNERRLAIHRFTMDEGTTAKVEHGGRSEREFLLDKFGQGEYQALVAMKCLDEGVDVPAARTAILLCSSDNPREYVQCARTLLPGNAPRRTPGIHDMPVSPSTGSLPHSLVRAGPQILRMRRRRCRSIARVARSCAQIGQTLKMKCAKKADRGSLIASARNGQQAIQTFF